MSVSRRFRPLSSFCRQSGTRQGSGHDLRTRIKKNRISLPILLAMVFFVGAFEPLRAEDEVAKESPIRIEFETYTLENGLTVILHEDRSLPVVHVNQWYHVGSKNENEGRTGFAHLFEHLMFQGSVNAPGEYFGFAERVGANLREGGVNGTTSYDRTNYFITAPSGNLEHILWFESDRMVTLLEALDQAKLDNQREVVRNERRMRVDNQPYGKAFMTMFENVFPVGHPYSWPVIGSHEDLQAATLDDVKEFFKTFYTPNNLVLTITGDFEKARAKEWIERYFGSIPPGPPLLRAKILPTSIPGQRRVVVEDRVPQARIYFSWPSVPYFHEDEADLDLAALILADGLSSRLQRELVYENQLCTEIQAFDYGLESAGMFVIIASVRPDQSVDAVETSITNAIQWLATDGATHEELARAKNKYKLGFVTDLEEIGGFGGKADRLAQYQTYFGTPDKFDEDLARYEAVTIESMKGAVSRYLDTDSRLIVQFVPEKAERSKAADPDRTKAPDLGTDREFQVPEVKGSKLENGLDLYVVEQHELPKVSVRLVVRAGAVDDPPEFPGLANLVLRTIDKGTSTMKALALEDAFADLGTSLSAVAGNEGSNLTVDVLVDGLEKTVDLLAQVASGAIFPDEELERERKKVLDDIAQQEEDPVRLAQRILPGLLFGPAHPYGHPRDGSTRSLPMIKAPRLREFHSSFFKASNAALVFVGDVTQERAAELAQKFFGSLEKGSPNDRTIPDPQPAPSKAIHFVNQPGAAQSVISLAVPGIRRKADDYYAVELANAILGGMFTSRLNMNLREDKGYTYGAFSSSVSRAKAGMWSAGASVQTKATKESMVEFIAEFEGLGGKRPVTEEELASAKDNKIRGYSQSFSTLARISAQIANIWVWTLPMSTLQEEPATLRSTGLDAVNQAGQARVMLENTRYLVVGDESVVLEGLESLSIGPTIKLDRQGEVLKN